MNVARLGWLAWQGLALHKLRSTLSATGIVFGVAAVVAMLSVGEGARRQILAEIGSLGITGISVRTATLSESSQAEARSRQSPGLTLDDARAIVDVCPTVVELAPMRVRSVELVASERRIEAVRIATTSSYQRTVDLELERGRFLSHEDLSDGKRVVILGQELAAHLFPYEREARGKVRMGGEWFTVVGTLEASETVKTGLRLGGQNIDRLALVPLTSVSDRRGRIDEIAIRVTDVDQVDDSATLIDSILRRRHRGVRDYRLVVPKELIAGYERARFQFNVVVGAVAALSLLVGGIGIMNIMLANVSERTREVGIRRSLGASRRDIVMQFLTEAILLTGAGGLFGLLVGFGASVSISRFAGWPTATGPVAILTAWILAVATGLSFGIYPAWQAATKSPVEALRHE